MIPAALFLWNYLKPGLSLIRTRWKEALIILGLMVLAWAWFRGEHYRHGEARAKASLASLVAQEKAAAARSKRVETVQAKVSASAESHERAAQLQIRTVYQTLTKQVLVHVPADADARCVVNYGFVRLHDASAAGVPILPDPAGRADDAASGVDLSTVAATVVGNYGAANGNAEELAALQAWVRAQQAASVTP